MFPFSGLVVYSQQVKGWGEGVGCFALHFLFSNHVVVPGLVVYSQQVKGWGEGVGCFALHFLFSNHVVAHNPVHTFVTCS